MTEDLSANSGESTGENELDRLRRELQECQERYIRSLAENENARKRMQRDQYERVRYQIEEVFVEFLHPLDHFEQALRLAESMSDEVKNWATGFEMILSQFKNVLSTHGIEQYASVGVPFDHEWHEAVEMVESSEFVPGTVVSEYVSGYKMGDRPLRVARVSVAKSPSDLKKQDTNQEEQDD